MPLLNQADQQALDFVWERILRSAGIREHYFTWSLSDLLNRASNPGGYPGGLTVTGGNLDVNSVWNSNNLLQLGNYDVWIDGSGNFRIKSGTPSSDSDGTVIGPSALGASLGPVGNSPNLDGASISGSTLTLQPADGTHPGVLTALAQNVGGVKTFLNYPIIGGLTVPTLINVKADAYGAKGDGVTDDTVAINKALSAISQFSVNAGGVTFYTAARVYFPAGIYKITGPLIYFSGSVVVGDLACIDVAAGVTAFSLNYNSYFDGLTFRGRDASSLAFKVANNNVGAYVKISNCTFLDCQTLQIDNNSASTTTIVENFLIQDTWTTGNNIYLQTGDDTFFSKGAINTNRPYQIRLSGGNLTFRDVLGTPEGGNTWVLVDGGLGFNAYKMRFGGEGGGDTLVEWRTAPQLLVSGGTAQVPSKLIIEDCEVYGPGVKFYQLPMLTRIRGNTGDSSQLYYDSSIPTNVRSLIGSQIFVDLQGNYFNLTISHESDPQIAAAIGLADERERERVKYSSYLTTVDRALTIYPTGSWGENGQPTNITETDSTDVYGDFARIFNCTNQSLQATFGENWLVALNGLTAGSYTASITAEVTNGPIDFQFGAAGKEQFQSLSNGVHVFSVPFVLQYNSLTTPLWQSSHSYSIGDLVVAEHTPYGHAVVARCVAGGMSGTNNDALFGLNSNIQITEGTVTWEWIEDLGVNLGFTIPPGTGQIKIGSAKIFKGYHSIQDTRIKALGSSIPVQGYWQVGDEVINTNPTDSSAYRWVCTKSGGANSGPWIANKFYNVGDCIINGSNVFQCTSSGTSASSGGPSGSAGIVNITDNTVIWNSIANTIATFTPYGKELVIDVTNFGTFTDSNVGGGATITNGMNIFGFNTSYSPFTSADINKLVRIDGAGPNGTPLVATITSIIDSGHAHLSSNASTTVTNGAVIWGHDDTPAIQAAAAYVQSLANSVGGGNLGDLTSATVPTLYFPSQRYIINNTIDIGAIVKGNNSILMLLDPTLKGFFYSGGQTSISHMTFRGGKYPVWIQTNDVSDCVLNIYNCEFMGQDSLGAAIGADNNSASTQCSVRDCHFFMGGTVDKPGANVLHAMSGQFTFEGGWIGAPVANDVFMTDGCILVLTNVLGGPADDFGAWCRVDAVHIPYTGRGSTQFTGTVTGATSGATGTVVYDSRSAAAGAGAGQVLLKSITGSFSSNETINGTTGSAIACTPQGGGSDHGIVIIKDFTRFGGENGGKTAVAWHGSGGSLVVRDNPTFNESSPTFSFYEIPDSFKTDNIFTDQGSGFAGGIWFDSAISIASKQRLLSGPRFYSDDYGVISQPNFGDVVYNLNSNAELVQAAQLARSGFTNPVILASTVQYSVEYIGGVENTYLSLNKSETNVTENMDGSITFNSGGGSYNLQWVEALTGWKLPQGLYTLLITVNVPTGPIRVSVLAADTLQNRTLPTGVHTLSVPFTWDGVGGVNTSFGHTVGIQVNGSNGATFFSPANFRVVSGFVQNQTPWIESYASALPTTTGRWDIGDRIYNSAPTPGGYLGWTCTTRGRFAPNWQANFTYNVGDYVQHLDSSTIRVYRVMSVTGDQHSGSSGPTGTGSSIVDNHVTWTFLENNPVFNQFGLIST